MSPINVTNSQISRDSGFGTRTTLKPRKSRILTFFSIPFKCLWCVGCCVTRGGDAGSRAPKRPANKCGLWTCCFLCVEWWGWSVRTFHERWAARSGGRGHRGPRTTFGESRTHANHFEEKNSSIFVCDIFLWMKMLSFSVGVFAIECLLLWTVCHWVFAIVLSAKCFLLLIPPLWCIFVVLF